MRPAVVGAALAMTLVTAACGSGTPGTPAGQDQGNGGTGGGGAKTVVQFWHRSFTPVENAWYKQVVKDFNASQDKVQVVDTEIPADAWDQKMKAAQAAGKAPDIYTHSGRVDDPVRLGQLKALDGLIPADKLGEVNQQGKDVSQVGGKWYAYPLLLEPQTVLFWNKDMFTKAGLNPDQGPKSWDELMAFCAKIKPTLEAGQYCISTAGDAATFAWSTVGQQMNFAGHTALSDDWTKATVNDAGYVKMAESYQKLYAAGYVPKQPLAPYVVAKPLGEKKVAMMVSGSWAMSELGSDFKDVLPITGVGPFVSADGDQTKPTSTLGNFKWVIDAKSKNPQASADFISWALAGDPKVLVPFFVNTQFTKASVRDKVTEAVAADPAAAKASWSTVITKDVVPYSIPEPRYPWDVSLAVGTAMEKAMLGKASPADAMKEADTNVTGFISKLGLPAIAPKG